MPVSIKDVEHVAQLARLQLTDAEKEKFAAQLNTILEYMEKLNRLDTSGVEPLYHVNELSNVFRDDTVEPSYPVEEILKNAPARSGKFFKVPNVIDDEASRRG